MTVQRESDKIRQLKACINDLISVLALPAVWSGGRPSEVGGTLLDALIGMLRLDFVFLRLSGSLDGGVPMKMFRAGQHNDVQAEPAEVSPTLKAWLGAERQFTPFLIANPIGHGKISIISRRLGTNAELGMLVAGSARLDFPTQTERLLLDVAANQAVIRLQGAQRLIEQRCHVEELDHRVAQRTMELADREARIRRLVDADIVGIIFWNFDGRILDANEAFLRMVGYNREDIASGRLRWTELTPPEWRDRDNKAHEEARTAGAAQPFEKEYFRKDGSRVSVLTGTLALENTNEGIAFVLDITERKKAERALARSEDHLRQVIDTIPQQIWSGPSDGTMDFCNARWRFELGLSGQALQGDGWQQVLHPKDRDRVLKAWDESVRTGKPFEQQGRHRMANGEYRWFLSRGVPLFDEGGQILRWFGSNTDIDDQKRAEDALRTSEQKFQRLVDMIPAAVYTCDLSGCITYYNRRAVELWGREPKGDSSERFCGSFRLYTLDGTPLPHDRSPMAEAVRTGKAPSPNLEVVIERPDLSRVIAMINIAVLTDEGGKHIGALNCLQDITERKRTEEALRRSEQRWRGVFDNSKVGIALQDAGLRYIDANTAFTQMVGYSLDDLQTKDCLQITYENKTLLDELLSDKRDHFDLEKRYLRKNGELMWARLNGSIVGPAGSHYWVVMAEDITERKHLGDRLQQERDRLRLLLELNHQFISKLELRDFLNAVLDGLNRRVGWEWATILLPASASDQLTVYLNLDTDLFREGTTVPIEGTLAGQVYRSGLPLAFYAEDLPLLSPRYLNAPWMKEAVSKKHLESGCVLPLIHGGQVLGVLFLMTSRPRDAVMQELDFLRELATLAAAALNNSLRFDRVNARQSRLVNERRYIEDDVRREGGFEKIIGGSTALNDVLRQASAVAPTDSTVLITGETGTGKELIARSIHDRSPRREHSFIKVDCAAIPVSLIESELFGHEKGSFTGAIAQKIGRFETADQGTIFLDEVGDVPLELQPKLLRVLQDREFERLGSNRVRNVDVRVVAATNRDLEALVERGNLREDLYYRLKVFPIVIPPLRERPEDIPLLVQHYVAKYAQRMRKGPFAIPAAAMEVFLRYPWPGNVRELQHFMERSVVISSGKVLQAPLAELERTAAKRCPATVRTLQDAERDAILQALKESGWVVGGPRGAAAKLGIKRTTLASRMDRLGIRRPC